MNYRNTLVMMLAIAVTPLALQAQPGAQIGFEDGWGPGRRDRGIERRLEMLTDYLELSETQVLQIEDLTGQHREARQTAFDSMRLAADELRTLIESDDPDATLVGQKVLAMHAARKAMREQGEADLAAVRDLLTSDQAAKFDALMELREMRGPRERGALQGRRGPRGPRQGRGRPIDPPTDD